MRKRGGRAGEDVVALPADVSGQKAQHEIPVLR